MKKQGYVGGVLLGGDSVPVQSMTTERTSDVEKSVAQIMRLQDMGCDIVRVAVLDEKDALSIRAVKDKVSCPIVADIHFSAKLAVLAAENGADKLRVNPGNLGGEKEVALVADCIKRHHIPVRVGANSGSLEREALLKYGRGARALVESALKQASYFEEHGVDDIVLSVKASDVKTTVEAYRLLSSRASHLLHIGVTEAGGGEYALVKSAVGIGALLLDGIGDTLRVSLSDEPEKEVVAAHEILRACGREKDFVEVVSCPTCGRCMYDCLGLAARVRERVRTVKRSLRIAVMGCVVNGPGEAAGCDLGIAGGNEYCVIIQRGRENERVAAEDAERAFFARLEELIG